VALVGLRYLAMPMREAGDALRAAVAIQSLREALRIYTRDEHPESWASTQLNLANALQYLPSSHPAENLAQAVEIYQELLAVRTKEMDPVGYARLLANQANALAHLGVFGEALTQLEEAHRLFHWHGEPELAAAALEQVARINERREEHRTENRALAHHAFARLLAHKTEEALEQRAGYEAVDVGAAGSAR
jgi:tetratricopeptide (TPR) repeat protein